MLIWRRRGGLRNRSLWLRHDRAGLCEQAVAEELAAEALVRLVLVVLLCVPLAVQVGRFEAAYLCELEVARNPLVQVGVGGEVRVVADGAEDDEVAGADGVAGGLEEVGRDGDLVEEQLFVRNVSWFHCELFVKFKSNKLSAAIKD